MHDGLLLYSYMAHIRSEGNTGEFLGCSCLPVSVIWRGLISTTRGGLGS
jgi:hypothetical protein